MSRLTFVGADQWRGRGRPKAVASQEVIDALSQTAREGPLGSVPLDTAPGTPARVSEVAQYRRELGAAAKVLGVEFRSQVSTDGTKLLFFQERPVTEADAS
jgi:hypothetical protein